MPAPYLESAILQRNLSKVYHRVVPSTILFNTRLVGLTDKFVYSNNKYRCSASSFAIATIQKSYSFNVVRSFMKRISRMIIALMLVFSMSFSVAFAAGEQKTSENKTAVQNGVFEKNGNYYYKSPKTGEVRKKAGFIKWNGDKYYVEKGGKIITSKTFRIGNHRYRAFKSGKIAVGVYRWGKKKKLYYSNPKNGRWERIKSHRCQKGVKWNGNWYYLQTNSEVATNRPVVINNLPYYADSEGVCTKLEINETKNPVLIIARKQLGKHKKSQVRKFWTWFFGSRFINTDATPWCGSFVGWCFKKAGRYHKIRSIGNVGYVPRYSSFAYRRDKWVKKSKAKEGDIIVFGHNRHVGIVERVYKGYIYTIEGNSGPTAEIGTRLPGAVTRRVYKLSDPDIKGVIHP